MGIAEFYRRVEYWVDVPELFTQEKVQYCVSRALTDEEISLVLTKSKTIAELEIECNKALKKRT